MRMAGLSVCKVERRWMSVFALLVALVALSLAEGYSFEEGSGGNSDNASSSSSAVDNNNILDDSSSSSADIEVDDGSSGGSSGREVLKCVCDGSCEHLRAEECRHGVTFDMCRCCLVCARGENEPCGGARGTCAFGLHCQLNNDPGSVALSDINATTATPLLSQEGTCSRVGRCGQLQDQYGCVVDPEGECVCLTRRACPGEKMFLFEDELSCRSRMAFLIAKKDLEPATSSALQQMNTGSATGQ